MPELPEVEAARALVETWCKGKNILKSEIPVDEKVIEGIDSEALASALTGLTIVAACRKAKHLWLDFGPDAPALLLHFGMTGSIVIKSPGGEVLAAKYERLDPAASTAGGTWPPKFCKLGLELSDGTRLAFTDPRRFGRVRWLKDPLGCEPLKKLAPDALTDLPELEQFTAGLQALSRKKALKIKALLLDQLTFNLAMQELLISGAGNWVADEVLYQARVHPEQAVASLTPEQVAAVHRELRHVVQHAVSVGADSERFPRDWLFHYRWTGKKAGVDGKGNAIEFVTVGSRTSAFVPALQKLSGDQPAKRASSGSDGDKPANGRGKGRVRRTPGGNVSGPQVGEEPVDASEPPKGSRRKRLRK